MRPPKIQTRNARNYSILSCLAVEGRVSLPEISGYAVSRMVKNLERKGIAAHQNGYLEKKSDFELRRLFKSNGGEQTMPLMQFYLNDVERKKVEQLKYKYKVGSATDVLKRIIQKTKV